MCVYIYVLTYVYVHIYYVYISIYTNICTYTHIQQTNKWKCVYAMCIMKRLCFDWKDVACFVPVPERSRDSGAPNNADLRYLAPRMDPQNQEPRRIAPQMSAGPQNSATIPSQALVLSASLAQQVVADVKMLHACRVQKTHALHARNKKEPDQEGYLHTLKP